MPTQISQTDRESSNDLEAGLGILESSLKEGALRWLHRIDFRHDSITRGSADREYWAWKLKDFSNGTHQAALSGFLDSASLLNFSLEERRSVVDTVVCGTERLQRANGSFEEAYPRESSLAVTSLVVAQLCDAFFTYPETFEERAQASLARIVAKSRVFLESTLETHGLISNHLMTVALALALTDKLEGNQKIDRWSAVLSLQTEEGWFPEYGGADPGYQSLLNHYLALGTIHLKDPRLTAILRKSRQFVSWFAFDDGSFAGEIGSRGTSICYPSSFAAEGIGLEMRWFLASHLHRFDAVTPIRVDENNFAPVFNSFGLLLRCLPKTQLSESIPATPSGRLHLPKAQLFLFRENHLQMVTSLSTGATRRIRRATQDDQWSDESAVAFLSDSSKIGKGRVVSHSFNENAVRLSVDLIAPVTALNSPLAMIALRLLGAVTYPFPILQRSLKRFLASYVMRQRASFLDRVTLEFPLDPKVELPSNCAGKRFKWTMLPAGFYEHMASANSFARRALGKGDK